MSSLLPFCQAFEENPGNKISKMGLVFQFLQNAETDADELSHLASDDQLKRFLFHIFSVIVENQFPSPSDGVIQPEILQILQHLTILAQNHPDLCDAIAEIAPFDKLPAIFFEKNIENDKIKDPQPSHLLSSLRFIAAISCSHNLNISSTQSLHILFVALFSLLEVQQLSCVSATAISGLAHNSSTALAFIKSLPNFLSLRAELASLLSSDDHSIVISSLSCLTCLFPCRDDTETLMKAAVHCIVSPPPYPLATTLATWAIRDLISKTPITGTLMKKVINALFKSTGMRALNIISLLDELQTIGYDLCTFFVNEKLLSPFLDFTVKSFHDFVSVAATHLLHDMFVLHEDLKFDDVDDVFSFALGIVASPKTISFSLLKVESLLLMLRLMLRSINEEMLNLLKASEQELFMSFQRHIERSNSFVAVNYFMFLITSMKNIPEWSTKLQQIVAESQFTALLVHVLTHAENRTVIQDSVYSLYAIMNGNDISKDPHSLFDTIVSGFCFMNKKFKGDVSVLRDTLESSIKAVKKQSAELEETKIQCKKEVTDRENDILELKEKIKEIEDINASLTYQVQGSGAIVGKKVAKVFKLKQQIAEQNKENGILHEKIEHLSEKINELTTSLSANSNKLHDLNIIEDKAKETATQNASLKNELQSAQNTIEDLRTTVKTLSENLESYKQEKREVEKILCDTTAKLNDMTTKYHDNDKQTIEALDQIKRFESLIQKRTERLTATEGVNRQLRAEIQDLEKKLDESLASAKEYRKQKERIEARLIELENAHREHETLYQFIHKVTEKAAAQEVSESTMNSDSDSDLSNE